MMKPDPTYPLDPGAVRAEPITGAELNAAMDHLLNVGAALASPMPTMPEAPSVDLGEIETFLRGLHLAGASEEQAVTALEELLHGQGMVLVTKHRSAGLSEMNLRQALGRLDRSDSRVFFADAPERDIDLGFGSSTEDALRSLQGLVDLAEAEPVREERRAPRSSREFLETRMSQAPAEMTARQARRAKNRALGASRWGRR